MLDIKNMYFGLFVKYLVSYHKSICSMYIFQKDKLPSLASNMFT